MLPHGNFHVILILLEPYQAALQHYSKQERAMIMKAYETSNNGSINTKFPIDPRLGQKIRELRKSQNMTIKELSEEVGCSTTHLTRIELAQRRVDSMSLLVQFSRALHVPTEELLSISSQSIQNEDSLIKVAFPGVENEKQEQIISAFTRLVTGMNLSDQQLDRMLEQATAYAEYCSRKNL